VGAGGRAEATRLCRLGVGGVATTGAAT